MEFVDMPTNFQQTTKLQINQVHKLKHLIIKVHKTNKSKHDPRTNNVVILNKAPNTYGAVSIMANDRRFFL